MTIKCQGMLVIDIQLICNKSISSRTDKTIVQNYLVFSIRFSQNLHIVLKRHQQKLMNLFLSFKNVNILLLN